jgi:drug/metabolite transporter (DMT)-like permease
MGYYLASLLDFIGLTYISAGLERLILFLYPTMVVLLAKLFYRAPVGPSQRTALLLSYLGILLVFAHEQGAQSRDLLRGASYVFASALVFALFLTGSGRLVQRFGSRRFTAYSMTVACVATALHFALSRPVAQLAVSGRVFTLALLLALFATVLPAFLMNAGIRRLGAGRAAVIGTVGPVATLAMAYVFLDEVLGPAQVLGATLVLGGVLWVSLAPRERIAR